MKRKEESSKTAKGRLPLIFSACISILAVFTASVSTFAWFQAEANVRIQATSSSTNITVSQPDNFELGNASLYSYTGNGASGYLGSATGSIASDDALVNFTLLNTTELKTANLSLSGLVPGRKMSFGIKIGIKAGDPGTISSASLSVSAYTTTNNNYRVVLDSVTDGSSGTLATYADTTQKIIRIEDVIKFHGIINTTGTFALGSSSVLTDYDTSYTSGAGLQSKSYTDQDYEISSGTSLSTRTIFIFYTIEFTNSETTWYQEYTYDDSVYTKCYSPIANNLAGNRYFYPDDTAGNSSCYEGLSFRIDQLEISAT